MAFSIVACLFLLTVAWFIGEPWWVERRRARIRARPFPVAWRSILRRHVPYVRSLPTDLQLQLKRHIQVFLAEKPIIGCAGLIVTDEMRVTIAAQACLLILNRASGYYPKLRQILLYPAAFVVDRVASDGAVLHERRQALAGESWSRGQVVLSWQDAQEGAAIPDDGRNVVIHEFAHQLDQQEGTANGAPWLATRERRAIWAEVMADEYARLRHATQSGSPSLISSYGATDPAEFFAVVSEVFFEQPERLAAEHPKLYCQLGGFYRIDPLSW